MRPVMPFHRIQTFQPRLLGASDAALRTQARVCSLNTTSVRHIRTTDVHAASRGCNHVLRQNCCCSARSRRQAAPQARVTEFEFGMHLSQSLGQVALSVLASLLLCNSAAYAEPVSGAAGSGVQKSDQASASSVPSGHITTPATTTAPNTKELFDPARYIGRWYEVASLKKGFAGEGQEDCHCTQVRSVNNARHRIHISDCHLLSYTCLSGLQREVCRVDLLLKSCCAQLWACERFELYILVLVMHHALPPCLWGPYVAVPL